MSKHRSVALGPDLERVGLVGYASDKWLVVTVSTRPVSGYRDASGVRGSPVPGRPVRNAKTLSPF